MICKRRKLYADEIIIKIIPLGAPLGIAYHLEKTIHKPGEIILLMSDMFEELFGPL